MDYLVVGESVAGVAAALEFAAAGHSVHIVLHHGDNTGLEDSFLIGPTPLNPTPMRGTAFADLTFEKFREIGVQSRCIDEWFGVWDETSIDAVTNKLVLEDRFEERQLRFRAAVFAPNGSERGLPLELEAPFQRRGVSYSAWSDIGYYDKKPVAVVGCGYHAFEQALVAAEHAASVTVLSENPTIPAIGLLEQYVRESKCLQVLTRIRLLTLEPGENGFLARAVVEAAGEARRVDASMLFVAHDPFVGWWAWGSEEEALLLREQGKLVLARIAAGVSYSNHAALFASGVRAARQCLDRESSSP